MSNKILKDPIYGYIEIQDELIKDVIDTPAFQRLRRVVQTSYTPLYSSAVHNRFTHSIGVYYLGRLAIDSILKNCDGSVKSKVEEYRNFFLYACLLHDVGHAPFSHTGECFYLVKEKDYSELHERLVTLLGSANTLKKDLPDSDMKAAAPHEIMSAIIGLSQFAKLFKKNSYKEFFARCITGYEYSDKNKTLENCLISLLNSKIIDVDKLDYLMRDTYMTGFSSVIIDYERLLSSLNIINDNGIEKLAFSKYAVSIIENVVYARDSEKKWIQIHPAVLYENYLIQNALKKLINKLDSKEKRLFSKEALTDTGVELKKNVSIRYLDDEDVLYLLKNKFSNEYYEKYIDRNKRMHPLWKSEAEYNALFSNQIGTDGRIKDSFSEAMEMTQQYVEKNSGGIINQELIDRINADLAEVENDTTLDDVTKTAQIKEKKNILKVLNPLRDFSRTNKIDFNFLLLHSKEFVSEFGSEDFSTLPIYFYTSKDKIKVVDFGVAVSSLKADKELKKNKKNDFYFIYHNKTNNDFDKQDLANDLIKSFI